jgi:hypothetical protein
MAKAVVSAGGEGNYKMWIARVYDGEGRIIWSDNSGFTPEVHQKLLTAASEVVAHLRFFESQGNRLTWDWHDLVRRAPSL